MLNIEPLVYVLILNYQSLEDTISCYNSVTLSDYSNYKTLIIDNLSPNNDGDTLKKWLPEEEFIQLEKNTGYAGGNNIGIKSALERNADYILILNPDIRIPPTGISNYIKIMEKDRGIFALNPIQLTTDGAIDKKFENEMFNNNQHPLPENINTSNRLWEVKTLFGASLLIRKEAIAITGGFDPLFFAYWEEVDLCRRLKFHGGKLVVTEVSPVIHLRTKESTTKPDSFILFLRLKGMYLYDLKNHQLKPYKSIIKITKECIHYINHDFNGMFPWKKRHFLKALIWIYLHLPQILNHRRLEKNTGCLYLPNTTKRKPATHDQN